MGSVLLHMSMDGSEWLRNHQVRESGTYLMTRTDDEGGYTVVKLWEYAGKLFLQETGEDVVGVVMSEQPVKAFDDQCRWFKIVGPLS